MADFNTNSTENTYENSDFTTATDEFAPEENIAPAANTQGMTMEEINDANKISVTIADYDTPIVVLFGPPNCGKTMTLVRLSRYLKKQGYAVVADTSFRPAHDAHYQKMCDDFNDMLNSDNAADNTPNINFMLVKVLQKGRPICQILEGPGEYYFNPEAPRAPFPRYVNAIINSNNRKIWAIMVEPEHTNKAMSVISRRHYADKVTRLKTKIQPRDKVMFIFNKIDETPFVVSPGVIRYDLAMQNVKYNYPNIFVAFSNVNPITKLWKTHNFDFIAMYTGDYSITADGKKTFQKGNDVYPRNLWNLILKRIRG